MRNCVGVRQWTNEPRPDWFRSCWNVWPRWNSRSQLKAIIKTESRPSLPRHTHKILVNWFTVQCMTHWCTFWLNWRQSVFESQKQQAERERERETKIKVNGLGSISSNELKWRRWRWRRNENKFEIIGLQLIATRFHRKMHWYEMRNENHYPRKKWMQHNWRETNENIKQNKTLKWIDKCDRQAINWHFERRSFRIKIKSHSRVSRSF